jgi:hypothetical protein
VEKKKKNRAGRMGFLSIQKTASTGSSATDALVGANSLQPSPALFSKNFLLQPKWRSSIGRCTKTGYDPGDSNFESWF